jgi:hypothetical protein
MAYEAPKDYIDVATRITEFRAKYPDGTLAPLDSAKPYELVKADGVAKDGKPFTATFVVVVAAAYRTPDDPRPGVGMAWEVFPGRTPYTLGSELMNAETSAWGRAIIAVGAADSKQGIASAEEVRNRAAEREPVADATKGGDWMPPANPRAGRVQRHNAGRSGPLPDDEWTAVPVYETVAGTSTPEQHRDIAIRLEAKGITGPDGKLAFCSRSANRQITSSKELSYLEAVEVIRRADQLPATPGPLAERTA